ncbi:hypothetical protein DFH06DRAFT_1338954 [Mycena polygramma]|nr:hypothetical protein DFH06DRAFT_1338954 [Mycena polygramma]
MPANLTGPEPLKEEGNVLFKAKDFHGYVLHLTGFSPGAVTEPFHPRAAEKYSRAAELAPLVAAYPGNLSAALTEAGLYLEAVEAIH